MKKTKQFQVLATDKRIRLGIWGLSRGMSFYITCKYLKVLAMQTTGGNAYGFLAEVILGNTPRGET